MGGSLPQNRRTPMSLFPSTSSAKSSLRQSEDRYRAFVMATSDAVYRMSPDWRIMTGLEGRNFVAHEKIPNPNWLEENIHPGDRGLVERAIEDAINRRGIFELEHRVFLQDGSVGWTLSRAIPLLDSSGEIVEWFGVARDITATKRAAEVLERVSAKANQDRRLYDAILSSTPDLVYVFGRDHRFTYANAALLTMWGKTWDEAIGRNCLELGYEPWHAARHDREIDHVIATKQPVRGEVPFSGTHGRRFYDYILVPVMGAQGEVEAIAGTTRDVTEMVITREELARHQQKLTGLVEERTAKLQEAVAAMEEFSYGVSHDLRAPLRAMTGYAEALLSEYQDKLDGTGRDYLKRIVRSGERMDRLTSDLLTYTRAVQTEVVLGPVSLDALVEDIAVHFPQLRAELTHLDIVKPLGRVIAHEPSLYQAISNLMTNAAKFGRPGEKPRIKIFTEKRNALLRIWVADEGIGIAPQTKDKLFGLFVRGQPNGAYEGTGIGLAIVKKVIERMRGAVGVESDGVSGSRFWIDLPVSDDR